MGLPAYPGLKRGREHLVLEHFVGKGDERARYEHYEQHPQQHANMVAEELRRTRGPLHKIDQLRNESREQYFAYGREQVEKENEKEYRPNRRDKVPIEREQRARRHHDGPARKRIYSGLKPAQH